MNPNDLRQLPCYHRLTIPYSYLDGMGHMNIQYYLAMGSDSATTMLNRFGMTPSYMLNERGGVFLLAQHTRYLAEIHVGQEIAVYTRLIGRSPKRLHFIQFLVNETADQLAATIEGVNSHAHLDTRRTTPYPEALTAVIDPLLATHQTLPWAAPLCGILSS